MAWSDYPFNRSVDVQDLPSTHKWNVRGAMFATEDRIHLAMEGLEASAGSLILSFDYDGVRHTDEDVAIEQRDPATMTGLTLIGTNWWILRHFSQFGTLQTSALFQYSAVGALGNSWLAGSGSFGGYGLVYRGNRAIILDANLTTVMAKGFDLSNGDEDLTLRRTLSLTTTQEGLIDAGLVWTGEEYFLLQSETNNVLSFGDGWVRDSGSDGSLETESVYPAGAGFANEQVIVFDWNTRKFYFYGAAPVDPYTPTPFVSYRQYRGLRKWENQFDVVAVGQDDAVTDIRAQQSYMLQENVDERLLNLGSTMGIDAQISTITFIPRWTIEAVEIGDKVIFSQGEGALIDVAPGAPQFNVISVSAVGDRRQVIYAERVTS